MTASKINSFPEAQVVGDVNQLGLGKAAQQYEVHRSNLWRWLKTRGYKSKRQYIKVTTTPQQT